MFEVEQKFHIDDVDRLVARLTELGARLQSQQSHRDTYFNHPCRDFRETREALRVRRVDGVPMVTYKGSLMPGAIKARRELEWRLDPGDQDGSKTEALWELLGFRRVACVEKSRRSFELPQPWADCLLVVDKVTELGDFAEIELLVPQEDQIDAARERITKFAAVLGLAAGEPRSYLTILLQSRGSDLS